MEGTLVQQVLKVALLVSSLRGWGDGPNKGFLEKPPFKNA